MQGGFTKYCCFLCLWDSRATCHHYVRTEWPQRTQYSPGKENISNKPLIDPNDVLLPPLHIKLGLFKNFVKALDKDGEAFQYLLQVFPKISYAKIKEGIFVGPQIRKLLSDDNFSQCLLDKEYAAWKSFKSIVDGFLGNNKSENYRQIVAELLKSYHALGARMSLKIHFLHSHLDFFPQNLGAMSDEQGERAHQDLMKIERSYQGFWDESMLGDYCWGLLRETDPTKYKRRSNNAIHF